VPSEVVLKRNGSVRLSSVFDFHILLSFDRLMETVRITATFHHTASLLIDDLHLTIHDDILGVTLKHTIGFEELVYSMNALSFHAVVFDHFFFSDQFLFFLDLGAFLQVGNHHSNIWKDKE